MPTYDWNTVIQLVSKTISRIVNYDDILDIPICNNSKIFDVNSVDNYTALPVQSMLNKSLVWIQVV